MSNTKSAHQHIFPALSLILIIIAGCSSQPPSEVGGEQFGAVVVDTHTTPISDNSIQTVTQDSLGGQAAANEPSVPLAKRTIYFDIDSYIIGPEYQPLLVQHASYLAKHSQIQLLIQGSADERGSREYNLALGQKRAEAIKRQLQVLGVSDRQLEAVSVGEEQPVCIEATESCWARNRKGELIYSGQQ